MIVKMIAALSIFRPPDYDGSHDCGNNRRKQTPPFLLVKSKPDADDCHIAQYPGGKTRNSLFLGIHQRLHIFISAFLAADKSPE